MTSLFLLTGVIVVAALLVRGAIEVWDDHKNHQRRDPKDPFDHMD